MTVRFVLGRAGSGKSQFCIDEMQKRLEQQPVGAPLLLLVPEQATFQAEQALLASSERGGFIRAQAFGFRRLAWRIMQETGDTARIPIDDLGKRMLLTRLLKQHQDALKIFHSATEQPGLVEKLNVFFKELNHYNMLPEQWYAHVEQLSGEWQERPGSLEHKLHDLSLLYRLFTTALAEDYLDAETFLTTMAMKAGSCTFLKDAEVWVDGFFGFTPQEVTALASLMQHCRQVTITLSLDRVYEATEHPDELGLFYATASTMTALQRAREALQLPDPQYILLDESAQRRFARSPMLAHLEKHYEQRYSQRLQRLVGTGGDIQCFEAVSRRAEVEGCAREMWSLVREHGFRWRDLSIRVRKLEDYGDMIAAVFHDYNIPFFMDQKKSIMHHPLTEFIRSSFEVVLGNWHYDAVFRAVKTDFLLPLDEEAAIPGAMDRTAWRSVMDQLENIVLARGIRGHYDWANDQRWMNVAATLEGDFAEAAAQPEDERLLHARRLIMEPFNRLKEQLQQAKHVQHYAQATFDLLEAIRAPLRLQRWSDECIQGGMPEKAREHSQVWGYLMDLLDQLVMLMGDEPITAELFTQLLDAGLESISLAQVPPSLDEVLIGTIDRTRSTQKKVSFVLGVSDGVLPSAQDEQGVLSDQEREWLREAGVNIAAGGRRKLLDEQLLIYSVLCTPSDYLFLSYPLADEEGRALQPSEIIKQVTRMFPDISIKQWLVEPSFFHSDEEQLAYIVRPERAMSDLYVQMKHWMSGETVSIVWWELYQWYANQETYHPQLRRMMHALEYTNAEARLSKGISGLLYGEHLRASVSRMEQFIACPFSQFTVYGLKLRERSVYRLEAPDIGQLYHAALSEWLRQLQHDKVDWQQLKQEEVLQRASKIVDELIPLLQREILLSSSRYRYIARKLKAIVGKAALMLTEHAKVSGFVPIGIELGFGPGEALPSMSYPLNNGKNMEIIGRIDRVDRADTDEGALLRIVDYKSSATSLKLNDLFYGLSLQMLTYLDVVVTHSKAWIGQQASPAGVLYFHVHNPVLGSSNALNPHEVEDELRKRFKMKGLVAADPAIVELMDLEMKGKSGHSQYIPVAMKADGSFYKNASVATTEQWGLLKKHVRRTIREIGSEIMKGNVEIHPYRQGNHSPCQYCSYKPVCHFDALLDGNEYQILSQHSKEDVWQSLAEVSAGAQDDRQSAKSQLAESQSAGNRSSISAMSQEGLRGGGLHGSNQ